MRLLVVGLLALLAGCASTPSQPPPVQHTAVVSWQPVTELTDQAPLTDLSGYLVSYSESGGQLLQQHVTAGQTSCTLTLTPGQWQFYVQAISAGDGVGLSSQVVSKTVQ